MNDKFVTFETLRDFADELDNKFDLIIERLDKLEKQVEDLRSTARVDKILEREGFFNDN